MLTGGSCRCSLGSCCPAPCRVGKERHLCGCAQMHTQTVLWLLPTPSPPHPTPHTPTPDQQFIPTAVNLTSPSGSE